MISTTQQEYDKLQEYVLKLSNNIHDLKKEKKRNRFTIELLETELEKTIEELSKTSSKPTSLIKNFTKALLKSEKELYTEREWEIEQKKLLDLHKSNVINIRKKYKR